tara:strand:+ start:599 stop:2284 length:1686 start_codon:yes stop_codon:yes gene_type:complete
LKILLTDGGYKNTLAAARALSSESNQVFVVGGRFCLSNLSKSCNQGFNHKNFGKFGSHLNNEMLHEFCKYLKENKFDLLIPVGGSSVKFVSDNRDYIKNYVDFVLPEQDKINLALDKNLSANLCKSLKIDVPHEYKFNSINQVKKNREIIEFPVVIKSSNELQKFPTIYCHSYDELINNLNINEPIRLLNNFDFPIIQQKVDGPGQGYFGVFKNGEVIADFMHERVRETPPSGGASSCAKSIYLDDLKNQGLKIIKELKWSGPAMIEFKRQNDSNRLFFMEINPKLWGSLDLAISSGVNIPQMIANVQLNPNIEQSTKAYKVGLKYSWTFNGEILHLLGRPSSFFSIFFDFLNPQVKKNIIITDIKPTLLSIAMSLKSILKFFGEQSGILRFISLSRKIGIKYTIIRLFTENTGIPLKKYSMITNNLYVGQQVKKRGFGRLKKWKISTIINLRAEYDYEQKIDQRISYQYFPVVEFQEIPLGVLLDGVEQITNDIELNKKVYIHCKEGVSRAPTLAVAYLLKKGMSLESAIDLVRLKRPFVNILKNQIKVLKEFEKIQKNL